MWSRFFNKDIFLPPKSSSGRGDILLFTMWSVVIFTIFSGSLRKWILGPGAISNAIFMLQLLLPYIYYVVATRSSIAYQFRTPLVFICFVFYLFITAINPMNNTLFHGVFGLVIHLAFWAYLLGYYKVRRYLELEKLTGLFIVILIGEVILASLQNVLPGTHILNRFATGAENNTIVGESVRVAGTFSYLGGFQAWVIFNGFFVWFLIVRRYHSMFVIAVFVLSLFAGFVSGSRGAVGYMLMISFFGMIYTGFVVKNLIKVISYSLVAVAILIIVATSLLGRFATAYSNFLMRVDAGNKSGELRGRVIGAFDEVINFKGKYPVFGIGLGSTYQGANILFGESFYAKEYGYYESELARIVIEGGFILFFARIILFIVLLQFSAIPFWGKFFLFMLFVNNMTVFNVYQGFFFVLGMIFVDRAYYIQNTAGILEKRKVV